MAAHCSTRTTGGPAPHPDPTTKEAIRLNSKPAHTIAPLALLGLAAASCGITEEEPAPPAETSDLPGQQLDEEAPDATAGPDDGTAPEADPDEEPDDEVDLGQQGVSAGHEEATEVAEQMFDQGGNAVDAAVAASFAISVLEPVSSGVGGGGSVIVAGPEGEPVFYDYREVVNNAGEIPDTGTGIPGFVAGMGTLHADHGQLEWDQVIAPAVEFAEQGVEVADYLAERIATGDGPEYLAPLEAFTPGGQSLSAGDTLVQSELSETLQRISEAGWEDYYTGELAESVTEQVDGIDADSLAEYEVITSEPVRGDVGDYEVVSASPALPGAGLIQMLQIAEAEGVADLDPESAEYIDTLSRAWAVAEETIRTQLGDPNFVEVPVEEITDAGANAQIQAGQTESGDAAELPLSAPADPEDFAHANTTHISVVDDSGLTVSMTNTITDFWGSGQAVDGYFLNNALDRFADIDSAANQPEPGRRTVTWSNPTMMLDDEGRPVMAIGTPGGMQILPVLATVISQWALQDGDLQEAVDSGRFRGEDSLLYLEQGQSGQLHTELADLGWQIEEWPAPLFGSVQVLAIDYDSGTLTGVDDPRRDGAHRIID